MIRVLTVTLAHPGWWAVFTSPEGEPIHVPIAAWQTSEYPADEQDESFTTVEALLPDDARLGLSIIIEHSSYDWLRLVGLFAPSQYEKTTPEEWRKRCVERLAWVKKYKEEHPEDEAGGKARRRSMN